MGKIIARAWAIYRHGVAIKGLLETLGAWSYLVLVVSLALSALIGVMKSGPAWERILVGLVVLLVSLFATGFCIACFRAFKADESENIGQKGTLAITRALFVCDEDRKCFSDVTREIQRLCDGNKLAVHAHQASGFGDPCKKHKPFREGHTKHLEIDYQLVGQRLVPYDKTATLEISENWALSGASAGSPRVASVGYVLSDNGKEGVQITMEGPLAHEVKAEPMQLGRWQIIFNDSEPLTGGGFFGAWAKCGGVNEEADLGTIWLEWWKNKGSPEGLAAPLRILYSDYKGTWRAANCEVRRNVNIHGLGFQVRIVDQGSSK